MRFPTLGKLAAIGAVVVVLMIVLERIDWLVEERRAYQREAVESVQQSYAGAQTLLGPVLRRECTETWDLTVGEGKHRRIETQHRQHVLGLVPARLQVDGRTRNDPRYRGLFKVNGYTANMIVQADWRDLSPLEPVREHPGSRLVCKPMTVWLSATDVRGLRSAQLQLGERALVARPGTGNDAYPGGLHAELPVGAAGALALKIELDLVGISELALVPAAEATEWRLQSDWPHPSFGGQFLPGQRSVVDTGFDARWTVSALATSAPGDVLAGTKPAALDRFAVVFVDPVNPTMLSDRAIKYGLLFVLLTFTGVGLAEMLARGRLRGVHPVQYGLVGLAVALFFLLLLSLSEHLAFGLAYGVAATACVLLLAVYGQAMLGGRRGGLLLGAGMGLMYGLLYALLLREHDALLIGSVGLFLALAAVMVLTRRVDWYRLAPLPGHVTPEPGPVV